VDLKKRKFLIDTSSASSASSSSSSSSSSYQDDDYDNVENVEKETLLSFNGKKYPVKRDKTGLLDGMQIPNVPFKERLLYYDELRKKNGGKFPIKPPFVPITSSPPKLKDFLLDSEIDQVSSLIHVRKSQGKDPVELKANLNLLIITKNKLDDSRSDPSMIRAGLNRELSKSIFSSSSTTTTTTFSTPLRNLCPLPPPDSAPTQILEDPQYESSAFESSYHPPPPPAPAPGSPTSFRRYPGAISKNLNPLFNDPDDNDKGLFDK